MGFSDLWFVLILSLSLTSCHSAAKQPNILLILADDYGWNDVGYHGSEIRTPTLDQLAEEGVKLENYYVQPICTPSRSQLMTGRYQIHTGLQHYVITVGQPLGLPLNERTLAEELRDLGYATHHVGKWHLGGHSWDYAPHNRGFDTFYGFLNGRQDHFSHFMNSAVGEPDSVFGYDFWDMEEPSWGAMGTYSTELFVERVENLMESHSQKNPDKPVFMYLALQNVHEPLQVPKRYEEQYDFILDEDRRTYAGMVSAMDEAVEKVTKSFRNHGLWNNTLLIFSADNGGDTVNSAGNNWPLLGAKNTLWEGGIRGVGFVSGPALGDTRRGTRCDQMIHVSDWFPTLLNLAGGSTRGLDLDSYDAWDSISKGRRSKRHEILHNIDPLIEPKGRRLYENSFDNRVHAAIRWRNWKLLTGDPGPGVRYPPPFSARPAAGMDKQMHVYNSSPEDEQNIWLFNIQEDPLETRDLSHQNPSMVRFLLDKLAAYNETAVPVLFPPFDPKSLPFKHGGLWEPWL